MINNKVFWKEFLKNFALMYSFIVGTIFVSYSIYRELFNTHLYGVALLIFIVYFIFWLLDKKRSLDGIRTETTNQIW